MVNEKRPQTSNSDPYNQIPIANMQSCILIEKCARTDIHRHTHPHTCIHADENKCIKTNRIQIVLNDGAPIHRLQNNIHDAYIEKSPTDKKEQKSELLLIVSPSDPPLYTHHPRQPFGNFYFAFIGYMRATHFKKWIRAVFALVLVLVTRSGSGSWPGPGTGSFQLDDVVSHMLRHFRGLGSGNHYRIATIDRQQRMRE